VHPAVAAVRGPVRATTYTIAYAATPSAGLASPTVSISVPHVTTSSHPSANFDFTDNQHECWMDMDQS